MNKADLIDNVAERLGHSKKDVTDIVDAFLLETKKAVAKGEKVAVAGFGVFESTARKARMGRNPRTGEPMTSLGLRWDMCVANRAFVVRELRRDLILRQSLTRNWHYE